MPAEPTFTRLADLAVWHEQQGWSFSLFQSPATLRAHREAADFYSRMLGNRAATDPNRLTLTGSLPTDAPARWCRRHGYRAVITGAGTGSGLGVIIQRGIEPPLVACLWDTLLWDGHRITILERP